MLGPGAVIPQLLGSAGVQYDIRQLTAIGAPMSETHDVCIAAKKSGIDLAVVAVATWRRSRRHLWSRIGATPARRFSGVGAPSARAARIRLSRHT